MGSECPNGYRYQYNLILSPAFDLCNSALENTTHFLFNCLAHIPMVWYTLGLGRYIEYRYQTILKSFNITIDMIAKYRYKQLV